jgi:DNA-binding response OmpR family regulator
MSEIELDLSGSKVLIVDDVPANIDMLIEALDDERYNVLVASDGETALEVASYAQPDLILLDVMMPGIDGYETCRRLKADSAFAAVPVIFLTARDDLEGTIEGFAAGGLDYVTKPFRKEEVLVRIKTHLERAILGRKLAGLNAHLEQKVEERTGELQLKLKELEGRDRIAQHLLEFHTLEETLAVVLEAIWDILELDKAVVYLKTDDLLQPAAAIGLNGEGRIFAQEELRQLAVTPAHQEAFARARERLEPVDVAASDPPFILVPILRDEDMLGLIEVENHRSGHPITKADLHMLESFALQAAVAIQDAQIRQDPEAWQDQLDELLELNRELRKPERLEELSDELDD